MSKVDKSLCQFRNCRIIRNGKIMKDDLWVRGGKIIDPEKVFYDDKTIAYEVVDCLGAIIAPGYIDLQINGGFGYDFADNTTDVAAGVDAVAKGLLTYGTTAFCPTVVSSSSETYRLVLPRIKRRPGSANGAAILGVHAEGPFISVDKKGAHEEDCIKTLDQGFQSVMDMYGNLENLCYVTLAPEIPNASTVIQELRKRNIKVSVGHSSGKLTHGEAAVKCGASFITHLFNAMIPFHHRDPGLFGLLASDQIPEGKIVHFGIIADGIHTHPAALRIAHRTHPEGLVLVTDAIAALGLKDGKYRLGKLDIKVENQRAYIAGTDVLCGSTIDMGSCVRNFKLVTGCSIVEAVEAATLHPARALDIQSSKGVLDFGADADLVMLDDKLNILSTWIAGKCVYAVADPISSTVPLKSGQQRK